jgi:crossover junction endodeoxyribonuclease RuvC
MIFLGIDPGESGGIAAVSHCGSLISARGFRKLSSADIGIAFEGMLDLAARHPGNDPPFATIERVHSMPKQGVASSFKFGRSAGLLEGILVGLRISHQFVPPQMWQKYLRCLSRGDKNVTKAKAQQLYADVKITHATADAILLAYYGWATYPRAVASATPAEACAPARPDLPL